MALNIALLTPHPSTPTYVLTCSHTFHTTVVDPTDAAAVQAALGRQTLDLIVLTGASPATLMAAETLHARTGAPILGGAFLREARVNVARYLENDTHVGLGPVGQVLLVDDPEDSAAAPCLLLAIGTAGVVFTGAVATVALGLALKNRLTQLPGHWLALGGHAPGAGPELAPELSEILG
jgi:hypothetical protein